MLLGSELNQSMDALEGNHLLAQGLAIAAASGVGKPADSMPVEAGNASSSSWVFPLLLSCLAGASTCFGAAVVFCFEPSKIRRSMAFSLSLAAAVMVTISVVSILPEVATGILVPADNSLPVALGSSSTERGALEANNSSSSQYDFFVVGFGNQRIVRTKVLLERLGSLCLGVFAYLVLAKLLHFLPEPENMYLFGGTAEEEGNDMEGNSYDLYLHANTNDGGDRLETATDWNSDRVRRRTTKRSHGSSSNNNNNTKTMDTTTNAKFHRGTSNETLSSSGTLVAIEHGTEDGSAGAYAYAPSSSFATKEQRKRSWRVALMLFASLLIHNFPEGLCVVRTHACMCVWKSVTVGGFVSFHFISCLCGIQSRVGIWFLLVGMGGFRISMVLCCVVHPPPSLISFFLVVLADCLQTTVGRIGQGISGIGNHRRDWNFHSQCSRRHCHQR